jgi:hypothetical protein
MMAPRGAIFLSGTLFVKATWDVEPSTWLGVAGRNNLLGCAPLGYSFDCGHRAPSCTLQHLFTDILHNDPGLRIMPAFLGRLPTTATRRQLFH